MSSRRLPVPPAPTRGVVWGDTIFPAVGDRGRRRLHQGQPWARRRTPPFLTFRESMFPELQLFRA
ncbi:hypothetical protein RADP37_04985 [Roseomonas mucosa]|uniref:Uncharacterized protein n=1 Tax=Roseomonas mucosa TaxID=207340 RepID=A0A4Y1MUX8_9PROT|nr:hypothetical protein RADP37_04985 [Roseomonas mucosa]